MSLLSKQRNSVTNIGDSAFLACVQLESIFLPDSVTSIGKNAFVACNKSLLTIHCSEDSYAAQYAEQNGIKVEYTDPIDPLLTLERSWS